MCADEGRRNDGRSEVRLLGSIRDDRFLAIAAVALTVCRWLDSA